VIGLLLELQGFMPLLLLIQFLAKLQALLLQLLA